MSEWIHTAFYRFTPLQSPETVAERLRSLTKGLSGVILVASEGINGTVAGEVAAVRAFEDALWEDPAFAGAFSGMTFKRSECKTVPFARMRVRVRAELVAFGARGVTGTQPARHRALSSKEWRSLLQRDDIVLLDNRSHFEFRWGHFKNAVDPQVERFSDFQRFVSDKAEEWKAAGKTVAMYCTGGIRCEKTGAWMEAMGLEVVQLEGGILQYFQEMPDAEQDWEGECFVFDNRIALNTRLEETAATAEEVFARPEDQWRLERALRLKADCENS